MKISRISRYIRQNKYLIFALIIGAVIRIGWYLYLPAGRITYGNGGFHYHAVNLLKKGKYIGFDNVPGLSWKGRPTAAYPPGYSALLAIVYFFFGIDPKVAFLLNVLISIITIWVIYRIADISFGRRPAEISSIIYAVNLPIILISADIRDHIVYAFLLALFVYATALYYLHPHRKIFHGVFSGIILGVVVYIRPFALLVPIVLSLPYSIMKRNKRLVLSYLLITLTIASLMIFPWAMRNYETFGVFSLSSLTGFYLWASNNPFNENRGHFERFDKTLSGGIYEGEITSRSIFLYSGETIIYDVVEGSELDLFLKMDEFQQNQYLLKKSTGYIVTHPIRYLKNGVYRVIDSFVGGGPLYDMTGLISWFFPPKKSRTGLSWWFFPPEKNLSSFFFILFLGLAATGFNILLLILSISGAIYLLTERRFLQSSMDIMVVIILHIMLIFFFVSDYRYTTFIHPFMVILSAFSIEMLLERYL